MKIRRGKLHENFERDNYWTRVYFESADGERKSVIMICASEEYFRYLFKTAKLEKIKLEQWLEGIINKWESLGENIFNKKMYYDVYADTKEGRINGLEFLQKEVQP